MSATDYTDDYMDPDSYKRSPDKNEPQCTGPHSSAFDCPVHDPRKRAPVPPENAPEHTLEEAYARYEGAAPSARNAPMQALEQTGAYMMANTNVIDGHSWVRHPAGDKELESIEWCQHCGTHKVEVTNWMENPQCPAIAAIRSLMNASADGGNK